MAGRLYLQIGQMYRYKGLYGKSLEYNLLAQSIINDPNNIPASTVYPNKTRDEIRLI